MPDPDGESLVHALAPARSGRARPQPPGPDRRRAPRGTPKTAMHRVADVLLDRSAVLLQRRSAPRRRTARAARGAPPGRGPTPSRSSRRGRRRPSSRACARRPELAQAACRTTGRSAPVIRHRAPQSGTGLSHGADDTCGHGRHGGRLASRVEREAPSGRPRIELPLCVSPCWGSRPSWQDAGGACSGYLVEDGGTTLLLDCGNGVFAKLRERVDYDGRRRDPHLPPARRPHPRPGAVLVRAHLRAAPAAGAGGRLSGDRQPRPPAPDRSRAGPTECFRRLSARGATRT